MENCRLDFDAMGKFSCCCTQNCVSIIYGCVWGTTNTYTPPESTANSDRKYMKLEIHTAPYKENLYTMWICSRDRPIDDHSNVISYTYTYTQKQNLSSLCPSLCLTDSSIKYYLGFSCSQGRNSSGPTLYTGPELGFTAHTGCNYRYSFLKKIIIIIAPVRTRRTYSVSVPPPLPRAGRWGQNLKIKKTLMGTEKLS